MNEITIHNEHGTLTVSSVQVAEDFHKQHKNVLTAIEELRLGVAENSASLFIETTYQHVQNKQWYKCYELTRDGFTLLAMGFTGKEALAWKLKYIDAFNKMEDIIKKQYTELEQLKIKASYERATAMRMNAENRRLKLLLGNPQWKALSDVALQTMGIKAVETVTGQNLGNLLPVHEKTYSATEIGKAFGGIAAQTIGKRAKAMGLQDGDVYGVWVMDKSRYSTKEVKAFRYNLKGVQKLADAFQVGGYQL